MGQEQNQKAIVAALPVTATAAGIETESVAPGANSGAVRRSRSEQ